MKTPPLIQSFLDFSNASPTPYHCVKAASGFLRDHGFAERALSRTGPARPGERFFVASQGSALIAVAVGGRYAAGAGATIMAAHTDSPGLQAKPASRAGAAGLELLAAQAYGGAHFDAWFDRDLSVAGRAVVRSGAGFETRLFDVRRPVLSLPRLAIHLDGDEAKGGFRPNVERHVRPVLGLAPKTGDAASSAAGNDDGNPAAGNDDGGPAAEEPGSGAEEVPLGRQHSRGLIEAAAEAAGAAAEDVLALRMFLYDTQPAQVVGLRGEFVHAARLDNQMMSFVVLQALVRSLADAGFAEDEGLRVVALFDNEEVGSVTDRGAQSRLLLSTLERIIGRERLSDALEASLVVSADMAHAEHPNYAEKHSSASRVRLGGGLVLKHNANERYATTDVSAFFVEEVARRHALPLQRFCARQDARCGSTIGPALSSALGVRTVDVGVPQLAMHSVREMCGVADVESSCELLTRLFVEFRAIDKALNAAH